MNQNTPSDPIPPEWLAAYADNELDDAARRRVERWLADHPGAVADLNEQRQLGPGNIEYWTSSAPPMPRSDAWNRAFLAIAGALQTARAEPRRSRLLAPILGFGSLAAAILLAIMANDRQRHDQQQAADVLVSEDDHRANPGVVAVLEEKEDPVYRVARVDDVELIQLPEAAAALVVVGRHPIDDVPVVLASAGDLQLLNYGPDDQGNLPDFAAMLGPDAPMLWAPRTKP